MANYPPNINLSEEVEEALKIYLDREILIHEGERSPYLDTIERLKKDYIAEPKGERDFPFPKAANIIVPLFAITFETIHAKLWTQAFGLNQITSAKAKSSTWDDYATPVERYIDWELSQMHFKDRIESAVIELEKFGTGICKSRYETITKWGVVTTNGVEEKFPVTFRSGATIDSVPLGFYVQPFSEEDADLSPWCGQEHTLTYHEAKLHTQSGLFYDGVDEKLMRWAVSIAGLNRIEQTQQELEHRKPGFPAKINCHEIWLAFDIDNEQKDVEIVVWYHRLSRTIMSVRYNWWPDLRRPFRTGVYIKVEHRRNGIGIGHQVREFQKEVTTQHRQRLDNATLANMRMIIISRLSGYSADEPVFPGKKWLVDDVTHINTLQLSEVYPSAFENEQATLLYHQQRSGINDLSLGMPGAGTPGTATDILTRIQEGNKRSDYSFANIKSFLSGAINDLLCTIQYFGPRTVQYFEQVEGGQLVQKFLTMPEELVKDGLIIEIVAAGQKQNKVLDRQNWQQIAPIITQYYGSLVQLGQLTQNPQIVQLIIQKAFGASTEVVRQILETFDVRNIDRIIVKEFLNGLAKQLGAQQPAALPSGPQPVLSGQPGA